MSTTAVTTGQVEQFLAGRRLAVVGVSGEKSSFGTTVYRAFRDHGYDAVPVHRTVTEVDGQTCYPDVTAVPGTLDGVVVMVGQAAALDVVDACARHGVPRVWLFKGLGAPGAVSPEAVARCEAFGIDVVAGACPLMFLEPVGWFHRIHRAARRRTSSLRT